MMPEVAAFLQMLDDAWGHPFESLQDVLTDVSLEEAAWQHPAYSDCEQEPDWPAPGTIRWQVAHVAHCNRYYTQVLRTPAGEGMPEGAPRSPVADWPAELAALKAAHAEERAAIAAVTEASLDDVLGNDMTRREFLAMIIRHDIWHAGQIAVARRLWRTR